MKKIIFKSLLIALCLGCTGLARVSHADSIIDKFARDKPPHAYNPESQPQVQNLPEFQAKPSTSKGLRHGIQKISQAELVSNKGKSLKEIYITPEELCEVKFEECSEQAEGDAEREMMCAQVRSSCLEDVCSEERIECLENADSIQESQFCVNRFLLCMPR